MAGENCSIVAAPPHPGKAEQPLGREQSITPRPLGSSIWNCKLRQTDFSAQASPGTQLHSLRFNAVAVASLLPPDQPTLPESHTNHLPSYPGQSICNAHCRRGKNHYCALPPSYRPDNRSAASSYRHQHDSIRKIILHIASDRTRFPLLKTHTYRQSVS